MSRRKGSSKLTSFIELANGMLRRVFDEARPIDWLIVVIDFIVLFWIAAANFIKVPHRWKSRGAIKRLTASLADGENLHSSQPTALSSNNDANAWVEEVKIWIDGVQSFLAKNAVRALIVFEQHRSGPRVETDVHPSAEDCFFELDARLRTLRSILENMDAYF
jgi:hypothetical protein